MLTTEQTIKLNHAIADRLLERLEFMPFQPDHILEFGCIDQYLLDQLSVYYPHSELYGLSSNSNISDINGVTHNVFKANLTKLPLADNSLDLIISNLVIDCLNIDLDKYFKELYRIVKFDGLLLFTMINNTTINNNQLLNIGDLLLSNKFCDPVIDQELININYKLNNTAQNENLTIEILYGHALGNNLIKTPINID